MGSITGKSIIRDVIVSHPRTVKVFEKYGFGCMHCPMGAAETIEQGALAHGIDELQFRKMLQELNKAAVASKRVVARKNRYS